MYVVSLDYFRPMEEVEALLAAHIAWLDVILRQEQ